MSAPPSKPEPKGAVTPKYPPALSEISARAIPNTRWANHHANKLMTLPIKPVVGAEDTLFVIGSCFAERIRMRMSDEGLRVGPAYREIPMAPDRYRIDTLPAREHMNYYNTFAIRQEFERHIDAWSQDPDDMWEIDDYIWDTGGKIYQDPYRRLTFGRTPEDLREAVAHINDVMRRAVRSANVFFMTLGIAEVFVNRSSGKVACQRPAYGGGGGSDETEFYMSTYEENYANMKRVVEIIDTLSPGARIVMTVSPVGLARTFTDQDVYVANLEGKAMLRAVLGDLSEEAPNLDYFPSYEMAMVNGFNAFYESDGRHINPWVVVKIVKGFMDAHFRHPSVEAVATGPRPASESDHPGAIAA